MYMYLIYRKCQFVHKMFVHTLNPPFPKQQSDGFPLEFLLKDPQTGSRTLSQSCEQTLRKMRTNSPKIANIQNYKQTGVSEIPVFPQEPRYAILKKLPSDQNYPLFGASTSTSLDEDIP